MFLCQSKAGRKNQDEGSTFYLFSTLKGRVVNQTVAEVQKELCYAYTFLPHLPRRKAESRLVTQHRYTKRIKCLIS